MKLAAINKPECAVELTLGMLVALLLKAKLSRLSQNINFVRAPYFDIFAKFAF